MSEQELDHQSVGVIIACPGLYKFLFQVNDEGHPDPRCRGRMQLWGGHMKEEDDNNPFLALKRELSEEWCDQSVVEEVSRCVSRQTPRRFILQSNGGSPHPYRYSLDVFLALAPRELFMDWFIRLEHQGFNEGRMVFLTREMIKYYISDKDLQRLFLGNLHEVMKYYFESEESLSGLQTFARSSRPHV